MQKLENRKETNAESSEGQKEGAQRTQREQREEERAQVKSSEEEESECDLTSGKHRVIECSETAIVTYLQEIRRSFTRNMADMVVNDGEATVVAFNRGSSLQHLI